MQLNQIVRWSISTLVLCCVVPAALGQQKPSGLPGNYPTKPIRIVVPSSPGGGSDISTRLIINTLSQRWDHAFVVDNVPGANGLIGMGMLAKAPPDGYTLMVSAGSSFIAAMVSKVPYDVRRAFVPVVQFTSQPYVLAASNNLPVNTVKELLEYAKARPGELNYASSGPGGAAHIGMEQFNYVTGIRSQHIPYKGIGPGINDMIAGRVQLLLGSVLAVMPQVKAGRLKALAVSSAKRSVLLPGIPAIAEDVPGFEMAGWYGLLAPAGTPPAIVDALSRDILQILRDPEISRKLALEGAEASQLSPEQFSASISLELDGIAKLIKETGIKLDQ